MLDGLIIGLTNFASRQTLDKVNATGVDQDCKINHTTENQPIVVRIGVDDHEAMFDRLKKHSAQQCSREKSSTAAEQTGAEVPQDW
jgi:hypothetical protein